MAAAPKTVAAPPAREAPEAFRPAGIAAARYEQGRRPDASASAGLPGKLVQAVRAATPRGSKPPIRDGALDDVARDLATLPVPPTIELLQFLLGHYGVFESEPLVLRYSVDSRGESDLLARARLELRTASRTRPWNRCGVAVTRARGNTTAILVLVEEGVALEPVPRVMPSGGRAPFRGVLARGFREVELAVTTPGGRITRPTVARKTATAFEAELRCDDGVGAYRVEVAAQSALGLRILANLSVHCGVEPPGAIAWPRIEGGNGAPSDLGAAEQELLALVNAERTRIGAPALTWDARLADVARSYSRELAEAGRVAHVSPRSGAPPDRLARAGLRPALAAENLSTGPSVGAIHTAIMTSPLHRVNVLDPEMTAVGIGLARGKSRTGATTALYATQLFARWR